ncbi:MAG TPA: cytochrome-c peroxidase [Polyangia bacterium]|jgi:hypothetical protein
MTIQPRPARLLLASTLTVLALASASCSRTPPEVGPTGTGGDIGPVPPSPLCSGQSNGGGVMTGPVPPGIPGFSPFPPQFGQTVTAPVAPPAISGGTLRVLADGHTAVASDPDRDAVYVVDLTAKTATTINLNAGDEPGRVVVDAAGRAHVALRHGGALVSIDTASGTLLQRRPVCAAPRGVAYDPASDLVHVACAGGELVSLPAAGGAAIRTVMLDRDLRDVVVDGPRLRVSRFLSAQLLTVEADGTVSGRATPGGFRWVSARGGQLYTPSTAWRTLEMPDGSGVMMLHQRGVSEEVQPVVGGYGGPDTCTGIVHPAVTMMAPDGSVRSGPALAGLTLVVDMAIAPDAKRIAFVSAGNSTNAVSGPTGSQGLTRVFVSDVDSMTDDKVGCMPDGKHAPCPPGVVGAVVTGGPAPTGAGGTSGAVMPTTSNGCDGQSQPPSVRQDVGQPIAVAFDGAGNVVVQSREPAALYLADNSSITFGASRADTGHLIFHSNAGGFLACASCHAEGNDDGRVWDFTCQGRRRTQSLHAGGLRGTEPFHWDGLETDMTKLMDDVFVQRMSGPQLASDQIGALMTWIDSQPRVPRAAPGDPAAVERGRALFNDATRAACATCHAGTRFTNNATVDVGTGGMFQVPSLVGIGSRGPFMHNGCAATLGDRFNAACGGDKHGNTAGLSANEISDLISYMQSI